MLLSATVHGYIYRPSSLSAGQYRLARSKSDRLSLDVWRMCKRAWEPHPLAQMLCFMTATVETYPGMHVGQPSITSQHG